MSSNKFFVAFAAASLMSATAAFSAPTTYTLTGNYSLSYSSSNTTLPGLLTGNLGSFTNNTSNNTVSGSFTELLMSNSTPPYTTAQLPFFTASPKSCSSCTNTVTGTISASFTNMKLNGSATALVSPVISTAVYTANYKNDTDSIKWTTGTTGSSLGSGDWDLVFNFTDGSELDVILYHYGDWNMTPKIVFDFVPGKKVPEPSSLVLIAAALLGSGSIMRRRQKRSAS